MWNWNISKRTDLFLDPFIMSQTCCKCFWFAANCSPPFCPNMERSLPPRGTNDPSYIRDHHTAANTVTPIISSSLPPSLPLTVLPSPASCDHSYNRLMFSECECFQSEMKILCSRSMVLLLLPLFLSGKNTFSSLNIFSSVLDSAWWRSGCMSIHLLLGNVKWTFLSVTRLKIELMPFDWYLQLDSCCKLTQLPIYISSLYYSLVLKNITFCF